MRPRDPAEEHRAATPLELLFDLVFVVAVSLASAGVHHEISAGHVASGLVGFGMVFFAIWWAWMNFSWFASAYDCDDALYRVTTLVQMSGVLILAAGISDVLEHRSFTLVVVGYVVMRVAMVSQWVRAARADPPRRRVALGYAAGIAVVQIGWVAWLAVPEPWQPWTFLALMLCELAVPAVAERQGPTTPFHPEHIAERYGSFTLIVLGESVLASTTAIIAARHEVEHLGALVVIAASAMVIVASMWWLYFDRPQHHLLGGIGASLRWGYGHYLVFAAAAAVSVGVEMALDVRSPGATVLGTSQAAAVATVPIAVFIVMFWFLALRSVRDGVLDAIALGGATAVGASTFLPESLPIAAGLTVLTVLAVSVRRRGLESASSSGQAPSATA
ncbi:low temperature requirement protein A [Tomitella biformata]|uniref:low temperature requirement protein A n=1 Tax=Tomitella biformata TaxID=630403 RepID=UPI0004631E63